MLNERQLKIVDLLEQQPRTPGELAQQTGVSGRTILRDIDYLNFTLNGKAAFPPVVVRAISWKSSSAAAFFSCCKSTITTIGCWHCYY